MRESFLDGFEPMNPNHRIGAVGLSVQRPMPTELVGKIHESLAPFEDKIELHSWFCLSYLMRNDVRYQIPLRQVTLGEAQEKVTHDVPRLAEESYLAVTGLKLLPRRDRRSVVTLQAEKTQWKWQQRQTNKIRAALGGLANGTPLDWRGSYTSVEIGRLEPCALPTDFMAMEAAFQDVIAETGTFIYEPAVQLPLVDQPGE